jgi:hypothetical protein
MWMVLFLVLAQLAANPCQPSSTQSKAPSIVVQVVDPNWLPVPGAEVTVKPMESKTAVKRDQEDTDKDGYAKFFVPGDADYEIDAALYGFKPEQLKGVHLFKTSGASTPAYVQLRLRLSGPSTTIY